MPYTSQKKTTVSNILILLTLLCVVLWSGLVERILKIDFSFGVVVVSFFLFFWFLFRLVLEGNYKITNNFYIKSFIVLVFIIVILTIMAQIVNGQFNIQEIFRSYFFYFGYLIFPCLVMSRLDSDATKKLFFNLMLLVILVSLAVSILLLVDVDALVKYNFTTGGRFELTRVSPDILNNLSMLALCFCVSSVIHQKNRSAKIFYSILLLLILNYLIFGWATRGITVQIIAILLYTFWRRLHMHIVLKTIVVIALTSFLYLSVTGKAPPEKGGTDLLFSFIYTPFDEVSNEYGTTYNRLEGMAHYWKLFKESGYIGLGNFDMTQEGSTNSLYASKNDLNFNLNDLGIMDSFYRYGAPALVFVVVVLFRIKRDLFLVINRSSSDQKTVIISESIYLFVTMQLLTIFLSKAFFLPKYSLFYGLILYFCFIIIRTSSNATVIKHNPLNDNF
jgi:hypothetical protein